MGETPFGPAGKSLGATVRPKRASALEAGAILAQLLCKRQQKAPIIHVRESRVALVSATSGGCQEAETIKTSKKH